jgi:DNA repair photolyase
MGEVSDAELNRVFNNLMYRRNDWTATGNSDDWGKNQTLSSDADLNTAYNRYLSTKRRTPSMVWKPISDKDFNTAYEWYLQTKRKRPTNSKYIEGYKRRKYSNYVQAKRKIEYVNSIGEPYRKKRKYVNKKPYPPGFTFHPGAQYDGEY